MSETQARFQNAILNARQLPPDLLTNSQKLKLYALALDLLTLRRDVLKRGVLKRDVLKLAS